MRKIALLGLTIAAVLLTVFITSPRADASDMEHVERHGNLIKVTDAASGAFYYQVKTRYVSDNGRVKVVIQSKNWMVDTDSLSVLLRIKNLPGEWNVRVTVIRGYGSSLVVAKRFKFVQE